MTVPDQVFPEYDGRCIRHVPAALASLLCGGDNPLPDAFATVDGAVDATVEHVVLVLVDGFGLGRWNDYAERTHFFRRFESAGQVTPLTSIYPSETAAAITTLHTGVPAADHGVIGWHVNRPGRGRVQPLPNTGEEGALADEPDLVARETVYERMNERGVTSRALQPSSTLGTPYADATLAGARTRGTVNPADAAHHLRMVLDEPDGPTYTWVYVPELDALAHRDGAGSPGWEAQLAGVGDAFARAVDALDDAVAERTLVCATADHGILNTDPDETVDVYEVPGVREALATRDGEPVPPSGSGRNVHLHLAPGRADEVAERLRAGLDAAVFTREEALDRELVGPDPSPAFQRRLGDVVVSHRSKAAWHPPGEIVEIGQHGGLSGREMRVPFAVANAADLRRGTAGL